MSMKQLVSLFAFAGLALAVVCGGDGEDAAAPAPVPEVGTPAAGERPDVSTEVDVMGTVTESDSRGSFSGGVGLL